MSLKPFNEFTASLTKEDINYICGADSENHRRIKVKLLDPNAMNEIAAFISDFSFQMTVRLLELYHKWISEQLP